MARSTVSFRKAFQRSRRVICLSLSHYLLSPVPNSARRLILSSALPVHCEPKIRKKKVHETRAREMKLSRMKIEWRQRRFLYLERDWAWGPIKWGLGDDAIAKAAARWRHDTIKRWTWMAWLKSITRARFRTVCVDEVVVLCGVRGFPANQKVVYAQNVGKWGSSERTSLSTPPKREERWR